MEVIFNLRK